jgi:hypothetical protein
MEAYMPQGIENINRAVSELCGDAGRTGFSTGKICVDADSLYPCYRVSLELTVDPDVLREYIARSAPPV